MRHQAQKGKSKIHLAEDRVWGYSWDKEARQVKAWGKMAPGEVIGGQHMCNQYLWLFTGHMFRKRLHYMICR